MTEEVCAPARRAVLAQGGAAMLCMLLAPRMVLAGPATVEAELKKLFGDKPIEESTIKIDLPQIAENGLVVPITVEVESPMTEAEYVKALHIFAGGNPSPQVASYYFTPINGRAAVSTRMRLAQSQTVVAIAEMSDGSLYSARSPIKVTIGGCGGQILADRSE